MGFSHILHSGNGSAKPLSLLADESSAVPRIHRGHQHELGWKRHAAGRAGNRYRWWTGSKDLWSEISDDERTLAVPRAAAALVNNCHAKEFTRSPGKLSC